MAAYPRERARYEVHCHEGSFNFEGKSQESIRLFCSEGDIDLRGAGKPYRLLRSDLKLKTLYDE